MIIACPSCDARYEVPDSHFDKGPRQVRCAQCRHQWTAGSPERSEVPAFSPPTDSLVGGAIERAIERHTEATKAEADAPTDPVSRMPSPAVPPPPVSPAHEAGLMARAQAPEETARPKEAASLLSRLPPDLPASMAVGALSSMQELSPIEAGLPARHPQAPELSATPAQRMFDKPSSSEPAFPAAADPAGPKSFNFVEPPILSDELDIRPRQNRLPITTGILLAVFLVALVCLAAARQQIAQQWPQTEKLYNKVGLRINHNGEGLDFVQVRSELKYEGGATTLVVEGKIHNGSAFEQQVPNVDASAIGADGKALQNWQIEAPATTVQPGEMLPFHSSIKAPQENVTEINLDFIEIKNDAD